MTQNVEKVLIVGLGMIGASIALASKSKGIKVIGFDLSKESIDYAVNNNIIDGFADSIDQINSKEYCKDIDLIIVWESFPETLKTAIPDLPLCVARAKIVSLEAFIFWELNPRWY